jgi:two-component sensor histidine kinase
MAQGGQDNVFYFVAHDNFFLWRPNGEVDGWGWPYFNFPKTSPVSRIWIDDDNTLYAGTMRDNFYIIKNAAKKEAWRGIDVGPDRDSNYIVLKGALPVEQVIIRPGLGVHSFAQDITDKSLVWIGTDNGLFTYNKQTKRIESIDPVNEVQITITEIYTGESGNIWFSTLEKGMGIYNLAHKAVQFYPYPKNKANADTKYPIKTFCYKSPQQFFVAVMDSLPAIFNTENRTYFFIDEPSLLNSPNRTTDIKVDKLGNVVLLKGDRFYIGDVSKSALLKTSIDSNDLLQAPFFRGIQLPNGIDLATLDFKPHLLKKIVLKPDQNTFLVFYDVLNFSDKKNIQFAWKIEGFTNDWVEMPAMNFDSAQIAYIQDLHPGTHLLQLKVRIGKEEWRKQLAEMIIIVKPPFWQTWWFWSVMVLSLTAIVYLIVWARVKSVRKQERIKAEHEKQLLELEAKALRAQMNPHFIFNCLNSIKSLIQDDQKDKSVTYLTTFSKLIRTLFNNADKKEINLFDEIETCKLYLQLESMRFDSKFYYTVNVDESIDLKSVHVPALIIQPFIENAIWHGIIPKGGGKVSLSVLKNNDGIAIIIDDDGMGREASKQNKALSNIGHQSKGVNLTQSRLELDNLLQQRQAKLEVIDKKNEKAVGTGTTVIIKIKEEPA